MATKTATPVLVTPTELSEMVGRNPKAVRAYLRKEFPRALEVKNSRWGIDATTVKAVTAHFAAIDAAKTAEAAS